MLQKIVGKKLKKLFFICIPQQLQENRIRKGKNFPFLSPFLVLFSDGHASKICHLHGLINKD
ncbi:Uncharacterized protein dnm_022330 [Desulfonema magnum]|uniref:Uncharacterized protein n=1 Tax=Desulfonema magnum TaxID=45655 RepID=A0A975BIK9_9BACT|nr:Uncharacterized protein dnm_022330 [Desulfonema magnum]